MKNVQILKSYVEVFEKAKDDLVEVDISKPYQL